MPGVPPARGPEVRRVHDVRALRARVLAVLAVSPLVACESKSTDTIAKRAPAVQSARGVSVLQNPVVVPEPYPPGQTWCSAKNVAWKIASPRSTTELGCPKFVEGPAATAREENDPFAGLGYEVLGHWDPRGTDDRREAGDGEACCYNWRDEEGKGRPLVVDGIARVAPVLPASGGWTERREVRPVETELARRLGAAWLNDALAEHASIASFARAALELMAVGAPSGLVRAVHAAALDEVRHARACFGLAAAYGVEGSPGVLPPAPLRSANLVELAVTTFHEGAVGETLGALAASRAAAGCADPAVRSVLEGIAEDETRHAELAWRTLGWALLVGGERITGALRAALGAEERRARLMVAAQPPVAAGDDALELAGRLGEHAQARARTDALVGVVLPVARWLSSGAPPGVALTATGA